MYRAGKKPAKEHFISEQQLKTTFFETDSFGEKIKSLAATSKTIPVHNDKKTGYKPFF